MSQRPADERVAAGRLAAGIDARPGRLPAAGPLHHAATAGAGATDRRQRGSQRRRHADGVAGRHRRERLLRGPAHADRRRRRDPPLRRQRRCRPRAIWRRSDAEQLAARLEGVKYQYEQAAAFQSAAGELPGYNLGEAIALSAGPAVDRRADPRLVGQLSSGAAPRAGRKEAPHDARLPAAVGRRRHPHHVRVGTHPVERRLDPADRGVRRHPAVRPLPVSPRRGRTASRCSAGC